MSHSNSLPPAVVAAIETAKAAPPVTRVLGTASLVLGFVALVAPTNPDDEGRSVLLPYLAASGYTLPPSMYLWTLITAGIFEEHPLRLVITLALVLFSMRYFEGVWGSFELARFVLVVNAAAASVVIVFQVFFYAVSFEPLMLYGSYVHGHIALVLAFLVAFKQLIPEHSLVSFDPIRIRTKDMPLAALCVTLAVYLLSGRLFMAIYAFTGLYSGWVYLRFFQNRDGAQGDRSETFAFAMFFPEALQPTARAASTVVFRALVLFRMCQRVEPRSQTEIEMEEAISIRKDAPSILGTDAQDAERRRQKALHALQAQLSARPGTPFAHAGSTRQGTVATTAPASSLGAAQQQQTAVQAAVTLVAASDSTLPVGGHDDVAQEPDATSATNV